MRCFAIAKLRSLASQGGTVRCNFEDVYCRTRYWTYVRAILYMLSLGLFVYRVSVYLFRLFSSRVYTYIVR
jgi:hypothetical protein